MIGKKEKKNSKEQNERNKKMERKVNQRLKFVIQGIILVFSAFKQTQTLPLF